MRTFSFPKKYLLLSAFGFLLGLAVLISASKPAEAIWCCCTCTSVAFAPCCDTTTTAQYISDAFDDIRDYITDDLYNNVAENDYKKLAGQLTSMWMLQGVMIGGFYDAQAHSTAMLELQKLTAATMPKYTPSRAVCQFGTLAKSLPASDLRAKTNQLALSEIALSRHLGTYNNMASAGRGQDMSNRILNYISTFCNTIESGEALIKFCATPAPSSERFNHDIDYTRTLAVPETINMDMTNATVTKPENDIISLGHNLYGHMQITQRLDDDLLDTQEGQAILPLIRSINAKRSLAENSYNAIAGMKAAGSGASRTYIRSVLTNLGMSAGDMDRYMASAGATPGPAVTNNPSYSAQMDILTKRVYQDPGFYVNLMDTPTNVSRQTASMEGLELMQGRDIFSSMSRSEMLLAVLVEMEAIKLQSNVENMTSVK